MDFLEGIGRHSAQYRDELWGQCSLLGSPLELVMYLQLKKRLVATAAMEEDGAVMVAIGAIAAGSYTLVAASLTSIAPLFPSRH